ncbi:glycosyltransferase family 4 protein [Kocuria sp. TGY1127_2]|uniref:glycosyltransferase family 4 protein n=1 Tax=Kocuria sp. TGY1127_2 TaxID=2711328 RepID=UPI0015BF0046|nr:glycosyltransferase family 4 protein [Kocuria sp. TGY1127_2]
MLTRTALQHAWDDPVHLMVQGSRRLPRRLAQIFRILMRALPIAGLRALSAYSDGDVEKARSLAAAVLSGSTRGFEYRLAAEVALEVGAVAVDLATLPSATRARAAWKRGNMSESICILEADSQGHERMSGRLRSEAETMDPEFLLQTPSAVANPRVSWPTGTPPRAFHVLTSSLPHTQSGYTLRTHRLLYALSQRGLAVQAVTRLGYPAMIGIPHGRDDQEIDGVRYRRILRSRLDHGLAARLQQQVDIMAPMVRSFRPTLLHCTTNYTNALMTDALARGFDLPWIYEVRGLLEETWAAGRESIDARVEARLSERFLALRLQETRMMHRADHVVTLSEVMKTEIVKRGVPAEKVTVVPNGVAPEFFDERRISSEVREANGLPEGGFWVGSVSSLVDYEGFDVLLRAVAIARQQGTDLRVLLAGDGASRPSLEKLAQDLGISASVTFTGRVGSGTARAYHRCLDLFCVPRTNAEVCRMVTPLKPIEAFAAGTQVLMSDVPPLRELAEGAYGVQANRALFVPGAVGELAAKLKAASAGTVWSEELRDAGRNFACERTWARNAATIEMVYTAMSRA